jgi:asparagine synthase (glutamine-hydrolysing)
MCGIFGIFNLDGAPVDAGALARATHAQRHRGPDDEGFFLADTRRGVGVSCAGRDTDARISLPAVEEQAGAFDLAFGFRRLSIQDLSPAGHQPMGSADGRLWIVFNGEIYNYIELRDELKAYGHEFRTGTDTEVILASYRQWGASCLDRFNGMWAFAVWDASARTLFLARDRFGEKPLHYIHVPGKLFAFSSEIKAFWAGGLAGRSFHEEVLARYRLYEEVDTGEQTFYEGVMRLPQAHFLLLGADGTLRKQRYWDIDLRDREDGKADSWHVEGFRQLFFESVKLRLRSDVAVGSSLSGGLDSSTVVCVMDRLLPAGAVQKTFSARFDDPTKDEGKWIGHVTAATRVEPHTVWPGGDGLFEELSKVFWHQDEPFGSTSIYAQWCVMRLAKEQGVTVLLDGQGADEVLAGYHHYFASVADELLRGLQFREHLRWKRVYRELHEAPLEGALGAGDLLKGALPMGVKRALKRLMGRDGDAPPVCPTLPTYPDEFKGASALRKQLWWQTTRKGLVELLRYADRNSMAHSREVRLPFLDHRLVEFAFRMPERLLLHDGWTKWVLRDAFRGVVPEPITTRVDKLGYAPPQQSWLGGQDWKSVMMECLMRQDSRQSEEAWETLKSAPVLSVR